jgi:HAD superfamily hydrolase (TIGR01509 family)
MSDMSQKAVIFDMDGTLIDSMRVWEKIDAEFMNGRGLDVPPDYFDEVAALGFRETANYTIRRFALPDAAEDLMREWSDMAAWEYGHNVPLKPGVREYLERLAEKKIKMAVATSSPLELCAAALTNNGIMSFFDVLCTAGDVERGKEFPDIFLYAAEKLSVSPGNCLVFEDNLKGVLSARNAGMSVWGVYDDSSKDHWDEIKRAADGWTADFADAPIPLGVM